MIVNLNINNQERQVEIKPAERLIDVLRREGFFSVKEGCRKGNCGACVVLLDGSPVNSCLIFAARCEGRRIETAESLGSTENLHPLQKAFLDEGAIQCGYCTPGMLLSAKGLLNENPHPAEDDIKKALDGNLCRCTGYVKIIKAVQKAAEAIGKTR
ncbi:MAG TPA: (2Fe-2S)-binding protein [Candidatus Sumerlaeota bacterium]|nr:MAG: Nicotinate dehydrogenase small FeS subunit [candidate division BRC1 bacterium ADurb.Bin183]HOE64136.1 (2Fe-2S)-binding protein [Candidatus Sumerlaeota bacterium]HRR30798.1 (2Fe-2S)-binding protein [Candidatus Sumerlaeia bacterium]HON51293.1 (2Fe-2S)-binding protein [Candidatus Sumerlaeota bacterium]HOR65671.1 (2Fe-2S)-binding protein [Candidatus Sumerlaeota bacterium]